MKRGDGKKNIVIMGETDTKLEQQVDPEKVD